VKAACDLGSLKYCSTPSTIAGPNCITYVDRVVRTRAAEKTSTNYSSSVNIPSSSKQTINDYYTALGDAASSYLVANKQNLSSTSVASLMNIFQAEQGPEPTMYNNLVDGINPSIGVDGGSDISWMKLRASTLVQNKLKELASTDVATIALSLVNDKNVPIFASMYRPVYDLILTKISVDDLVNDALIDLMTRLSPYLRANIDAFIIDYIAGSKYTAIPLGANGKYAVDLSARPRLYNTKVRQLYKVLSVKIPGDKLVEAIAQADTVNITLCQKASDPFTDPLCIAMASSADPALVAAVASAQTIKTAEIAKELQQSDAAKLASDCAQVSNMSQPVCIAYINNQISTDTKYDTNVVYMNVLKAATNADGSLNKSLIDQYKGMKQWLLSKTADTITTVDGVTKITSICGVSGGLTLDQCGRVCEIYPELCIDDQSRKCSLPEHRYAKDGFCDCAAREKGSQWWILFIIIFIFITVIGGGLYTRRRILLARTYTSTQETSVDLDSSL
jgi:hypothetical protein